MDNLEPLEKKCPRCGKASANSSNKAGRCSACLKKLRIAKKTPGTYQHEHKLADDALRRQNGKNGTASKKSKGRGTRKGIISKIRAAYKKYGKKTTLSPDRKNNSEGYSSSNTRMVPKKLNRGRHHVDGKKLKAWMKKSELEADDFVTLLLAKAYETDTALGEALESLSPEEMSVLLSDDTESTDTHVQEENEVQDQD
jgi:hypothetical protein